MYVYLDFFLMGTGSLLPHPSPQRPRKCLHLPAPGRDTSGFDGGQETIPAYRRNKYHGYLKTYFFKVYLIRKSVLYALSVKGIPCITVCCWISQAGDTPVPRYIIPKNQIGEYGRLPACSRYFLSKGDDNGLQKFYETGFFKDCGGPYSNDGARRNALGALCRNRR